MIAVWSATFVLALVVASLASRRAVSHAMRAADASGLSAGFVGMTVVAIGTDLPEIANSIISAATGHGDLAVGDTAGSALTQITLVLGILCFSTTLPSDRRNVTVLGVLTATALGAIALLVNDGWFGRVDGSVLVITWIVVMIGLRPRAKDRSDSRPPIRGVGRPLANSVGWLAVVAVAATAVVQSFVRVTESLGIPEIVAGAVILALGTSLPELIVDWTAIRRGATALALGDLFGSSFLDATFAIGIGPALTPTSVSGAAAATCVVAAIGVLLATAIAGGRPVLDRRSAIGLGAVYAVATVGLLAVAQ